MPGEPVLIIEGGSFWMLCSSYKHLLCTKLRPSKLDCLFSAMAILLLHAGGWFIFIIHVHSFNTIGMPKINTG